ncbi:hypothetical protein F4818DRAFT_355911 [Hypoxylon cercidicola]|nr:hypothetical protein F4818DRAFT_355911 [Hypoxylon cercidicola]
MLLSFLWILIKVLLQHWEQLHEDTFLQVSVEICGDKVDLQDLPFVCCSKGHKHPPSNNSRSAAVPPNLNCSHALSARCVRLFAIFQS